MRQQAALRFVAGHEQRQVRCPCLSQPIHASETLFESRGIPWQLEADDPAAARLKIQPLSGHVRRKQHGRGASKVPRELRSLSLLVLTAVHHGNGPVPSQSAFDRIKRIPELTEDDDGFSGAFEERFQPRDLAFASGRVVGELAQAPKPCPFVTRIKAEGYPTARSENIAAEKPTGWPRRPRCCA